jgi:hypothetical protein
VQLTISDREPFGGSIVIDSAESGTQRISPQAATNVFVDQVKQQEIL